MKAVLEISGHVLDVEGIRPTSVKTTAIKRTSQPKDLRDAEGFVGRCNSGLRCATKSAKK